MDKKDLLTELLTEMFDLIVSIGFEHSEDPIVFVQYKKDALILLKKMKDAGLEYDFSGLYL